MEFKKGFGSRFTARMDGGEFLAFSAAKPEALPDDAVVLPEVAGLYPEIEPGHYWHQAKFRVMGDWLLPGRVAWVLGLDQCCWLTSGSRSDGRLLGALGQVKAFVESILGPGLDRPTDAYNKEWVWELPSWGTPDPYKIRRPALPGGWRPARWGESPLVSVFKESASWGPIVRLSVGELWKGWRSYQSYNLYEVEPGSGRYIACWEPDSFTRETKSSGMEKFGLRLVNPGGVTIKEVFDHFKGEIITIARKVVASNSAIGRHTYGDSEITANECASLFITLGVVETPYFLWEPMERFFREHRAEIYGPSGIYVPINPEKGTKFAQERLPQWEFVRPFPLEVAQSGIYVPWDEPAG